MIGSVFRVLAVLLVLPLCLGGLSALGRRLALPPEVQRKCAHTGLGLACLSFPWIFHSVWELAALCALCLGGLLLIRSVPRLRNGLGAGLFAVERKSGGDVYFAVAVLLLFALSGGRLELYVLPLLILTLSDSAAALAGTRYGSHVFRVSSGFKSWEGSAAFFVITVVVTALTLRLLTPLDPFRVACIALLLGLPSTLVEAVFWHGLDNLFVPVCVFLLLNAFLEQSAAHLALSLAILIGILATVGKLARYGGLNTHALLWAALTAFFFQEAGGVLWLLGVGLVFFCHIVLVSLRDAREKYGTAPVFSVASCGVFWLCVDYGGALPAAYFLFILSMAIHLQIILLLHIRRQRGQGAEYPLVLLACLAAGWLMLPLLFAAYPATPEHVALFASGFVIMAVGGVALDVESPPFRLGRWMSETVFALGGSLIGLLPAWLFA